MPTCTLASVLSCSNNSRLRALSISTKTRIFSTASVLGVLLSLSASVDVNAIGVGELMVDDFESGLAFGSDGNGNPVGFYTFQGAGSVATISATSTPPAPLLPAADLPNNVLQVDLIVPSFAGLIHAFENAGVDTWVTRDWSGYVGIGFWIYGQNSGTSLFFDIIESRNAGSTTDDAERWTVNFVDDFSGWQRLEFPFASFTRKDIGNGAPNDGLTLENVHGWAFGGALGTPVLLTYYLDDVFLYGVAEVPPLTVSFANRFNSVDEGAIDSVSVVLNRPMNADDPAQVSIDYLTVSETAAADRDYIPTSGTLTFINGGPRELFISVETLEDTKSEGEERFVMHLENPIDVDPGLNPTTYRFIWDNDPFDRTLIDDFEQGAFLWSTAGSVTLDTVEAAASDPWARPGQDDFENILLVTTAVAPEIVVSGNLCKKGKGVVPVAILTTDSFDATKVDHTTVRFGAASEAHRNKHGVKRHEEDVDGDGDIDLVFHFRVAEIGYDCGEQVPRISGITVDGDPFGGLEPVEFRRDFPLGQDWSEAEGLRFWYYGGGSGDEIIVTLKDNRAPDPGPTGWNLVWSDEFDDPEGTPPNPADWSYELGGNGWGYGELQTYTDDPANAATDGSGNLELTLREADGSLDCFYGSCEYTSARLVSKNKQEFAYGLIEARIKVPDGEDGMRASFWSLGTNIDAVGWPTAGQIDFMDFVGREPTEIFGAIQGPGYSGGAAYGALFDFGEPVANDFRTYSVEWEPDSIKWYVDGIMYHSATSSDPNLFGNNWVFNNPFFLLLNVSIGGNFGGPVGTDIVLPQSMLVDYVRVYQGPDTAERFETSFIDNFTGWTEVFIPFASMVRSTAQPAGAPDDGLGLSEVWGYGFSLPNGGTAAGVMVLDLVRLQMAPE